jgi:hypothetical protein
MLGNDFPVQTHFLEFLFTYLYTTCEGLNEVCWLCECLSLTILNDKEKARKDVGFYNLNVCSNIYSMFTILMFYNF